VLGHEDEVMLPVGRSDTLTIAVSDGTFDGNCAAGSTLSQDDADFIMQRIFLGTSPASRTTRKSTPHGTPPAIEHSPRPADPAQLGTERLALHREQSAQAL
jgi:hypothetical protein